MIMKCKGMTLEEGIYKLYERYSYGSLEKKDIYEIINKLYSRFEYKEDKKHVNIDPMTIEIAMGNEEEVNRLIESGSNVNEINSFGMTPLVTAIYFNNYNMVNLLIQKGADVNLKVLHSCSPLHFACTRHNDKIVKLLLEKGANPNEICECGYNPLQYLLSSLVPNNGVLDSIFPNQFIKNQKPTLSKLNCIDLLVDSGLDINYCNEKTGINALSLALERIGEDYIVVIEKLIQKGADKKAIEINPSFVYTYQDSFNFLNDLKDFDLSLWPEAPHEYLHYLQYKRTIKRFGIEVYAQDLNDGYRRSKLIKPLHDSRKD